MHFHMNAHMSCQFSEPSLTPSHMHMPCMKNLNLKKKDYSLDNLGQTALLKIHVYFVGNDFSGSHRRCHEPSDTFVGFHRWIHRSNQGCMPFT